MFSYLIGETKKITAIKKSAEPAIKKLNLTLDKIIKASKYKKVSEPHITNFFERKDTHRKKTNFISPPSINLWQYTFKEADPTVKLLEKPLNNIIKTSPNYLEEIRSFFKDHEVNNKKEKEGYDKVKDEKKKLDLEKIPESKLKKGISTALKRVDENKPISSKVIALIEEICSLCAKDRKFYEDIERSEYGKFSIFTDLNSTKHWVDKEYHSIVRGTPAFIACVDFDIYLSEGAFKENKNFDSFTWEEIVNKLKSGPNIARWGEGGVVFLDYGGLDEMGRGYDKEDPMFIEVGALRNAGMKIKKYKWEEENETKDKNANKIKG